ncbi:MAG: pilus assembly protein, partial [Proteobacteria bacterium]|nr:pilus assembly protein [Pseudomonadota bacterium]
MNIYRRTRLILRKVTARLAASRRGAAAVEFAIIVPVLATAVIGIANYGLVTFDKMELVNAARAGAQLAIANGRNPPP